MSPASDDVFKNSRESANVSFIVFRVWTKYSWSKPRRTEID